LAIYHLTAKVISRARGQSVTAVAAYRSGSALRDERYGLTHNYTRHRRVEHAEIMSPGGSPPWVQDRETLWNRVEAGEHRKDSQLARAIEISLPVELSVTESVALLRDYIAREFVSKGMIADFCIRRKTPENPHAHILLTLREATPSGFGPKVRQWNRKSNLLEWRSAWAERANQHLARAGHAVRIDHRTLEAQQIELAPGRNMGVGRGRQGEQALPGHMQERVAEQHRIAIENGEMIIGDPSVALRALCRQRQTFIREDLVRFLEARTGDPAQLDAALAAVMASPELAALPAAAGTPPRFTSRDMLEAEKSLMKRTAAMQGRRGHGVAPSSASGLPPDSLSEQQRSALDYLAAEGDVKALAVTDQRGRGALLAVVRGLWESRGFRVIGLALSRIAAEHLQTSSGIPSLTLAAQEEEWKAGRDPCSANHVIVVEGAEMIGLKQLERLVAVVDQARGKIVLLGESRQLEAMASLSPLRSILDKVGLPAPASPGLDIRG
jgi:Ti-type conjugative transfer relaxase TraA